VREGIYLPTSPHAPPPKPYPSYPVNPNPIANQVREGLYLRDLNPHPIPKQVREGLYLGDLSGPESRLTLLWLGVRGVVPMPVSNPTAPRTLGRLEPYGEGQP
jgi:hypothetical protein